MGRPSYMRFIVDRNFVMRRITVLIWRLFQTSWPLTGSCSLMVGNTLFFCTSKAPVITKAVYIYHFPLPAGFQEDCKIYIGAPINRTVHALPSILHYDCNFLPSLLVLFHWKPVRQWHSPEINRGPVIHFQGPKSGSNNFKWRIRLKLKSLYYRPKWNSKLIFIAQKSQIMVLGSCL